MHSMYEPHLPDATRSPTVQETIPDLNSYAGVTRRWKMVSTCFVQWVTRPDFPRGDVV